MVIVLADLGSQGTFGEKLNSENFNQKFHSFWTWAAIHHWTTMVIDGQLCRDKANLNFVSWLFIWNLLYEQQDRGFGKFSLMVKKAGKASGKSLKLCWWKINMKIKFYFYYLKQLCVYVYKSATVDGS